MLGLSNIPGPLLLFCSGKKSDRISCQGTILISFALQFLSYRHQRPLAHPHRPEAGLKEPREWDLAVLLFCVGWKYTFGLLNSCSWTACLPLVSCWSLQQPLEFLSLCSRDDPKGCARQQFPWHLQMSGVDSCSP